MNDEAFIYETLFLNKGISKNISILISGEEKVGTSWCALSLAHAFNLEKRKVLLVDGNGNFSNIKTHLFLDSCLPIEEYVNGNKTLNQLIYPYKNKDFNILTATSGNNYFQEQPLGRIQVFTEDLQIVSQNYDTTIIDLGQGFSPKNISLYQIANNILIMCSDNNANLIKTFDLIKLLNEINIDTNYYLIINKVISFEDGYKVYEKLNKAAERNGLRCPKLLGIIRIDTRIRDTIRNKELLLTRYPTSEAALDICSITKKLIQGI